MSFIDDKEAFALASTYNFCPIRLARPTSEDELDAGKYEPDHFPEADERFMVLAQTLDATNILIAYEPAELPP